MTDIPMDITDGVEITPGCGAVVKTEYKDGAHVQVVKLTDSTVIVDNAKNSLNEDIPLSVVTNEKVYLLLQQIRDALAMPVWYVDASNSLNTSGTSTVTFAANQDIRTVTTVSTLSNQTNIGGFSADMVTENDSFIDWATSIRSLIN
jgi:uncharacterized protein YkvS